MPADLLPDAPARGPAAALIGPVDRRLSAAELAYQRLRGAILSLAMPPGTQILRAEIAAQLQVSQTPVREALIRLQEEGLIEVVPHSATKVARIDLDGARQAHFLRLAVELEMARGLAADLPPALRASLPAHLRRQEGLLALGDHAGFIAADGAFHAALYGAARIEALWHLIQTRSGHLDRLRRLHLPVAGKAEAILAAHRALAEALLAADPARAQAVLRAHLSDTFASIDAMRAAQPDYF